jgi:hypothetical protein
VHLLLDPTAWLVVVAFSLLGSFGNLALYQVGKQGLDAIRQRFPRIKPEQRQRVKRLYDDYGGWMLLLSGIPVLGSMLTTVAGAFGVPDGLAKRVIMAQGGITGGWSVYVRDGKPKYCYNFVGLNHYFEEGEKAIPVGTHQARIEFDYDGGGLGRGGTVTLYIDGGKVGEGRVD